MTDDDIAKARRQIKTTRALMGDEASNYLPIGVDVMLDGWSAALDEVERLTDLHADLDREQVAWITVADTATFDELMAHGKAEVGDRLVAGMPWAFSYKAHAITHENDDTYLVTSKDGTFRLRFCRGDLLVTDENGGLHTCTPTELASVDDE